MSKAELYKTAYSHIFDCYVKLTHAYQVDDGHGNKRWLWYGENLDQNIGPNHIFSEYELSNFCL